MDALIPQITDAGITASELADGTGFKLEISHIAFGDGNGAGYIPTGAEIALKNERVRIPISGGQIIGPKEIQVQAFLDTGPAFWIREIAFILADGTMLAVWSAEVPLAYKTAGVPLALAYNLVLEPLPSDSVTIVIGGPSINLTIVGPFGLLSAEIIRAHRLAMTAVLPEFTTFIERIWR